MWIEWKINKDLEVLRDVLVNEYLEFNNLPYKQGSSSYVKVRNVLSCLLNNLSYSVRVGKDHISVPMNKNAFSKSVIYNGVDTGRKVMTTLSQ